jgi:hypothetical protein
VPGTLEQHVADEEIPRAPPDHFVGETKFPLHPELRDPDRHFVRIDEREKK